jgi:hypothetical protein
MVVMRDSESEIATLIVLKLIQIISNVENKLQIMTQHESQLHL